MYMLCINSGQRIILSLRTGYELVLDQSSRFAELCPFYYDPDVEMVLFLVLALVMPVILVFSLSYNKQNNYFVQQLYSPSQTYSLNLTLGVTSKIISCTLSRLRLSS